MHTSRRDELVENLVSSLPVLRTMLHLSQQDLANILGISRQQIVAIENKKRRMTWPLFLSAILIFKSNEGTSQLLSVLGIYTEDLDKLLKNQQPS